MYQIHIVIIRWSFLMENRFVCVIIFGMVLEEDSIVNKQERMATNVKYIEWVREKLA